MTVRLARIYRPPDAEDAGLRVLVDRLWPRGVAKADAPVDRWLKDVAPSPELRRWFGHRPERFTGFAVRYRDELAGNRAFTELQALLGEHGTITLLYSAKDTEHNHAVVLAEELRQA